MRKAIFLNMLLLLFLFIFNNSIFAHPGRTAADGCHYCRTNCDYWGVPWNERHCHGGNPPTNTPIPLPTWTPVPTKTPTPTNTPTPTLTNTSTPAPTKSVLGVSKSKNKKVTKKKTVKKKTFWQWLFNIFNR